MRWRDESRAGMIMAYAAVLLLGLALVWFGWIQAIDPYWLGAGACGLTLAFGLTLLMRALDHESAPYMNAPNAALDMARQARRVIAGAIKIGKYTAAGESQLSPALIRLKAPQDERGRIALANTIAGAASAVVVDMEERSLLVHVLVENDADEATLRALGGERAS